MELLRPTVLPPPALPGFIGTTTLSATPRDRFRASRRHRWSAPLASRPKGLPVLHTTPFSQMPSPLPWRNRWVRTSFSFPNGGGLPPDEGRSASALSFSRPAQRSLHVTAYALAESLTDPFTPECFSRFLTSTTVPIATGWNDPCRVGFAPTETAHLCTAHFITTGYESLFPGSSRFSLTKPGRANLHRQFLCGSRAESRFIGRNRDCLRRLLTSPCGPLAA